MLMADVFLSYANEDRTRVAPIVSALEERGRTVWWDRSLRPGETWPQVIERELNLARCVVVAWSKYSKGSPWVRLEANRARERHNIVPVLLDDDSVPPEFLLFQSFDLRGPPDEQALERLSETVSAKVRKRKLYQAGIASTLLVACFSIVAAATCLLSDRCGSWSLARVPPTSFAVVATKVRSSDVAVNEVLEAFVDDVRRTLRRTAIGKVSSRAETSALPEGVSPVDLGKRLRVRWLVALSIADNSDRVRVLVELVDTSSGYLTDDWVLDSSIASLNQLNAALVRNLVGRFVDDVGRLPIASNEPSEAYTRYLEGRAALRQGSNEEQLSRAQTLFESILERWPRYALAEAALCNVHLLRYENTRAPDQFAFGEQHCRQALEIDPQSAEAAAALGQLYLGKGRNDLAKEAFTRAIAASDTLADARMGLGSVAVVEGRNDEAEREFRLAVDAEPGYWRTYTALGNFMFQTGRGEAALVEHRRAAALAQHDGVALNNIGAALFLSGQMDAAINAWDSALRLAPQAPTYSNLGAAYYLLGDYDHAVTMYERSVALVADDYRTWTNLADARAFGGRADAADAYTTAATLIERDLATNPNDLAAHAGLAAVRAALGDRSGAQQQLQQALAARTSGDWQLAYLIAVTYARLGMAEQVRESISALLEGGYPKAWVELDPVFHTMSSAGVATKPTERER
jgi:tetratricopeptide (TPR) repeat protein